MKRFWFCLCLLGIFARWLLATPGDQHTSAQTMTVASFNKLFRTLDLNAATQKSYSITQSEYAQLLDAWNRLAEADRMALRSGSTGWTDFAAMLLFDLYLRTPWEMHVKKAARYGATGISITVSRYKRILALKKARKTLVDLLQEGPPLVVNGRLVLSERIKSEAEKRAGGKALQRLNRWERLINRKQSAPDRDKMKAVAAFFEKYIQQTPDRDEAKGYDYWQSPIETLVRGKGDCDDFAVAHYVSLRLLGIPTERLRIGLVTHPVRGGHGVVFFYEKNDSDPWVIDNLLSDKFGSLFGRILPLSVRMRFDHLKPLWGLNETMLSEFGEDRQETPTYKAPREAFPAFAIALANSRRLLDPARVPQWVSSNSVKKTGGAKIER